MIKILFRIYFLFPITLIGQSDPLLDNNLVGQQKWVDSIYSELTLDQKIGQLFMPMVFTERDSSHYYDIYKLIKEYKVGGLVFSLGGPVIQSQWLNNFQKASSIPLLVAMDAEWGVAMRLDSVSPFPWPMTLGAIKDTTLLRRIGNRMGRQERRLGIHYSFSPTLDINTNPKNPIIGNRSYGSSSNRVSDKALAIMKGHQEIGILTAGKHFPGHGDTSQDSHKTLPSVNFSLERIKSVELAPYRKLISEGISSVMVAHLDIPSISMKGLPTSLSKEVIQNVLKKELDFKGLVVTDAMNMKGVTEYSKVQNVDLTAFLAGHDIIIISNNIPRGIKAIKDSYKKGIITDKRLSYSVKKILKAKYKAGLNRYRSVNTKNLIQDLNTVEDDYLIYEATAKSLTLLKNKNGLLPLKKNKKYGHLSIGDDFGNSFKNQISKLANIISIEDFNTSNILKKTSKLDTIIVSFHRSNKSPWMASNFSKEEVELVSTLAKHKTLILDIFVKPYALEALENIIGIDALIVSYQNSKISQKLSAEAIFGSQQLVGELPVNVSPSFREGDGVEIKFMNNFGFASPSELGFDPNKMIKIDDLSKDAIDSLMTPGMRVLVARKGKIVYDRNFGYHTYEKKRRVMKNDIYDLASLTKILATLPLVIKSFSNGEISFETTISDLLPDWKNTNKSDVNIKKMLSHQAYLFPWIPFYEKTLNSKGYPKKSFYQSKSSKKYSLPVVSNLFLKTDFDKEMYKQIKESTLLENEESKYSDLPYYILKLYFEKKYDDKFENIVYKNIFKPLGLNDLRYQPLKYFKKENIVPSEVDNYFRKMKLQGYVHDMGAAMQSGVGGHAGLFGNAYDVAAMMLMYLQDGNYNGLKLLDNEIIDAFNKSYFISKGNRRGVGFDKPQISGNHQSTCGCVSEKSFGHSGYTGTYAWADPEKEIIIVILANRTYPNDDKTFSEKNIRTRIQEYVYEALIN